LSDDVGGHEPGNHNKWKQTEQDFCYVDYSVSIIIWKFGAVLAWLSDTATIQR